MGMVTIAMDHKQYEIGLDHARPNAVCRQKEIGRENRRRAT
jgi:hypothetical protein